MQAGQRSSSRRSTCWPACLGLLWLTAAGFGQVVSPEVDPLTSGLPTHELIASQALRDDAIGPLVPGDDVVHTLSPEWGAATLAWIAVVVILVLTLQSAPLATWHNLDGLILAITCLLLLLRTAGGYVGGYSVEFWVTLLLTVAAGYWLLRGLQMLLSREVRPLGPNVSEGAMTVLLIAVVVVAFIHIARAPLSEASYDGVVGGVYLRDTGKLPYGQIPGRDERSPLLYAAHTAALTVFPAHFQGKNSWVEFKWANRGDWLGESWWDQTNAVAPRIVNATLFVLLFAAVAGIGHRLHSVAAGQALCAILCIFPATLEVLNRPDVLLPATLLAWSLAFVSVPVVGSLLSLLAAVLAGVAWPYAWLTIPVYLGYFLARRWHAVGALLGLLGGAAGCVAAVVWLTPPALPRVDGAMRLAAVPPEYAAEVADDGTLLVKRYTPQDQPPATLRSWVWKRLLELERGTLASAQLSVTLPNGVDAGSVPYRRLAVSNQARSDLQQAYREDLAAEPWPTQAAASLRTVLEATWYPAVERPQQGVWQFWSRATDASAGLWIWLRRGGKILTLLAGLFAGFLLLRSRPPQRHQLIGGLLVVCSLALIVSPLGAVQNWLWLLPIALAALAARPDQAPSRAQPRETYASTSPPGPAPRITTNN